MSARATAAATAFVRILLIGADSAWVGDAGIEICDQEALKPAQKDWD